MVFVAAYVEKTAPNGRVDENKSSFFRATFETYGDSSFRLVQKLIRGALGYVSL
jgi:hypothetical protein